MRFSLFNTPWIIADTPAFEILELLLEIRHVSAHKYYGINRDRMSAVRSIFWMHGGKTPLESSLPI